MGKENLHAYQNKDDAAKELWFETTGDGLSEETPQMVADDAEEKGYNTNNQQGHGELGQHRKARTGKRDADGQRIDARGNGQ